METEVICRSSLPFLVVLKKLLHLSREIRQMCHCCVSKQCFKFKRTLEAHNHEVLLGYSNATESQAIVLGDFLHGFGIILVCHYKPNHKNGSMRLKSLSETVSRTQFSM